MANTPLPPPRLEASPSGSTWVAPPEETCSRRFLSQACLTDGCLASDDTLSRLGGQAVPGQAAARGPNGAGVDRLGFFPEEKAVYVG